MDWFCSDIGMEKIYQRQCELQKYNIMFSTILKILSIETYHKLLSLV